MSEMPEYGTAAPELRFFDIAAALQAGDGMHSRVDMAKSPNSYIAVFGVGPRAGETRVHSHPDSDQILFVMKGVAPPNTTMREIFNAGYPFIACQLVAMLLILLVPEIAMWLVNATSIKR